MIDYGQLFNRLVGAGLANVEEVECTQEELDQLRRQIRSNNLEHIVAPVLPVDGAAEGALPTWMGIRLRVVPQRGYKARMRRRK